MDAFLICATILAGFWTTDVAVEGHPMTTSVTTSRSDPSGGTAVTEAVVPHRLLMDEDSNQQQNRTVRNQEKVQKRDANGKLVVKTAIEQMDRETDESCVGKRGVLLPFFENSKYFADTLNRYSYEEAKDLCRQASLVIGEIDGVEDSRSVGMFFNKNTNQGALNPDEDKYFIGLNDKYEEGVYVRADERSPTFQNYHTSQPDDKNKTEDCSAVGKEVKDGPVGVFDEGCDKRYHAICMFQVGSSCLGSTVEAMALKKAEKEKGLQPVSTIGSRQYFVSTFPETWQNALDYCRNKSMYLFEMDGTISLEFFMGLGDWEDTFINATSSPPTQYWTSGKFQQTHMNAEVYWHNEKKHSPEEMTKNFTFTGVFRWSDKKAKDPGGQYESRRDLCLSFSFEGKPDVTPYARNTNCGLPLFFVCRKDIDPDAEGREKRAMMVGNPSIFMKSYRPQFPPHKEVPTK